MLQGVVSKASFSSATAQWPKILQCYVSPHQQQLCQKAWEEASPHHPHHYAGRACGLGRRWLQRSCLAPIQRQQPPSPPVFSTKPLPTQVFQYHLAHHHCGAQGHCQVTGPMCVVLSNPRTRMRNGKFVYTEPSQFPARPWASVRETKVATTKYGCSWTLLATSMLTPHVEIMSNGSFL